MQETKITTISKIAEYKDQEITIKGWLYNKRHSGKIMFLIVRDGTGFVQCVVGKRDVSEEDWEQLTHLTQESAIIVSGNVVENPRAPHCGYELPVKEFKVVSVAQPDYPLSLKEHGPEFLMDNRHLWLRTPSQSSIMRIRHQIIKATRQFFDDRDFTLVDAPILTPTACEGTTSLFEVDYFEDKAYLTQSGQLYMEAAAMALGKVYCFGPAFRAEKSKTRRHLTEFWMIEPEIAYLTLEENMKLQEDMTVHIVQSVLKNCYKELKELNRDVSKLERILPPFTVMSYDEAVEILKKAGAEIEWGGDFGAPDEAILTKDAEKPIFVHRFPTVCKAFYMKPDPERPEVALGVDMLAPEGYGEVIGGGQRIDDYDLLVKKIEEHKLDRAPFEWYLDLRKYGSVPHGGFGLGIERCVAWICGIEHVRETTPFARTIYRLTP